MENDFNLNLKGGKLVKLGNQGVGMQRSLNLNLKGLKMNNIGKSRCWETKKTWKLFIAKLGEGRPKCLNLNVNGWKKSNWDIKARGDNKD